MKKVTILSRVKFLDFMPPVDKHEVVAIRISDHPPIADTAEKRYADTLRLGFYDEEVYAEDLNPNDPAHSTHLTEDDKVIIDNFIDKHAKQHFVVHCDAGRRRSAAVGFYILKRLGYTDELNEKKEEVIEYAAYEPNVEVYGLLTGRPFSRKNGGALRTELKTLE